MPKHRLCNKCCRIGKQQHDDPIPLWLPVVVQRILYRVPHLNNMEDDHGTIQHGAQRLGTATVILDRSLLQVAVKRVKGMMQRAGSVASRIKATSEGSLWKAVALYYDKNTGASGFFMKGVKARGRTRTRTRRLRSTTYYPW